MLGNTSHTLDFVRAPWYAPWDANAALPQKVFLVDGRQIPFRFNPPTPFPLDELNLTGQFTPPPNQTPNSPGLAATDFDKAIIIVKMVQDGVFGDTGWCPPASRVWELLWPDIPCPIPPTPYESSTP